MIASTPSIKKDQDLQEASFLLSTSPEAVQQLGSRLPAKRKTAAKPGPAHSSAAANKQRDATSRAPRREVVKTVFKRRRNAEAQARYRARHQEKTDKLVKQIESLKYVAAELEKRFKHCEADGPGSSGSVAQAGSA